MQDSEHSDGIEKDKGKKTTDAMVYSQHDCMVVRICQEAYVEARQSIQYVAAGHWSKSFQASFFLTRQNAVTTAVKRISRVSERDGKEKEEMLKEDLERNVTLCLHFSFCRNRESQG